MSGKAGLLLLGHGSHLNPRSSESVVAMASSLREGGEFAEVHVGFWKEEPSLSRSLDAFDTMEVVVVPAFIAGGYFVEEVIPRELRLSGRLTILDGRTVRYANPLGVHPRLAEVICERATAAGAGPSSAVVVLGHGTKRTDRSARNVIDQASFVEASGAFAETCALFIDQEPNITGVWEAVAAEEVVVVPLFMSAGWHVGETIPADLLLEGGLVQHGRRHLTMTEPVGTHPGIVEVVRELALEALNVGQA